MTISRTMDTAEYAAVAVRPPENVLVRMGNEVKQKSGNHRRKQVHLHLFMAPNPIRPIIIPVQQFAGIRPDS